MPAHAGASVEAPRGSSVQSRGVAERLLRQGGEAIGRSNFEQARTLFEDALDLDPANPVLHYNLGIAHYGLQRFHDAITSYNRALALRPDSWLVLMNRGVAHSALKDWAAAILDLDRAALLAPGEKDVFFNRALVRGRAGDMNGAMNDLTRVIDLDCADEAARAQRAALLRHLGRSAEAEADLEAARRAAAEKAEGRGENCNETKKPPS